MKIAILGGGNGAFAAAGDLTLAGHEIRLWRREEQAAAAHRAAGSTIMVKDHTSQREARIATESCISSCPMTLVRGAEAGESDALQNRKNRPDFTAAFLEGRR